MVKGNGDKETETEPNKSQIERAHNRAAKVLGSGDGRASIRIMDFDSRTTSMNHRRGLLE